MPAVFWLDPYRPHENELIKKVKTLPQGSRHHRPRHPDHVAGARHALHARARHPRPRHHLRHRQHPARLPDRPVPDHGTRHLGQDALHRSADERRRHVRNRRRRLGPEARAAAHAGKPPALGFAGRVPRAGRPLEELGIKENNARAKLLAKTLDAATGKLLDNNKSPSPKTGELDNRGSQFTSPCTGRRNWPRRPRTRNCRRSSPASPRRSPRTRRKIVAELKTVQGKEVDIGGYYKADSEKCKAVMRPSPRSTRR